MVQYGIPMLASAIVWLIRRYVKSVELQSALVELTNAAERAAREVEQTMRGPGMSEKKQAAAIGAVVHRLGGEKGVKRVARALNTPHAEMLARIEGEVESAVAGLPQKPSGWAYVAPGED